MAFGDGNVVASADWDVGTNKKYLYTGFSSTVADSFIGGGDNNVASDGTNLFSADRSTPSSKFYKHDGFSSTILDSFTVAIDNCSAMTIYQDDIYAVDDNDPAKFFHLDGFSKTVLDSFTYNMVGGDRNAIGVDNDGNFYTIKNPSGGGAGNPATFIKFDGFSKTVAGSFTYDRGGGNDNWHAAAIDNDGNLIVTSVATSRVIRFVGFTKTVDTSFSPATTHRDVEWDNRTGAVAGGGAVKPVPTLTTLHVG